MSNNNFTALIHFRTNFPTNNLYIVVFQNPKAPIPNTVLNRIIVNVGSDFLI